MAKKVIAKGDKWDCESAEEFLDRLTLRKSHWRPEPGVWLFRGQADDWPLVPKAYRDNGNKFRELGINCPVRINAAKPTASAFEVALHSLMARFRMGLDNAGLSIPAPAPPYSNKVEIESSLAGKVPSYAMPLLALAQHVGLPTPLLDWTTRPFVAAYFALPRIPSDDTTLVVWALRQDTLWFDSELGEYNLEAENAYMRVETAPRASNPNLHAQSGVFTLIEGSQASEYTVDGYIEAVAAAQAKSIGAPLGYSMMRRLTLPGRCAKDLHRLLVEEGITGASMFPGPEGVVRAIKERAVWARAQPSTTPYKPGRSTLSF